MSNCEETNKLIEEINKLNNDIKHHGNIINEINNQILLKKKELFNKCPHVWYYVNSEPFDSLCKWRCKFCNLWKRPNFNF